MGNKRSGNRTHIRNGRKPILCQHGVLGKTKCKECMRILKRQGKDYVHINKITIPTKRCTVCKTIIMEQINKRYICHDCFIRYYREKYSNLRAKRMVILIETLGKSCKVCGSEISIIYHEIHGDPHRYLDAIKRPEDFVALCRKCHCWITRLYYTKNPEEAIRLIRLGYKR